MGGRMRYRRCEEAALRPMSGEGGGEENIGEGDEEGAKGGGDDGGETVRGLMDRSDWAARLFHVNNAKLVGVAVVLLALGYQASLRWVYAEDSCVGLLEDGRWQGEGGFWQPYGCMLHRYRHSEPRRCLQRRRLIQGKWNRIAFVGDERLWQLYRAFLAAIRFEDRILPVEVPDEDSHLDPEINLTLSFHRSQAVDHEMKRILTTLAGGQRVPDLVVLETGLRSVRQVRGDASTDALDEFAFNLTQLREPLKLLQRPLWMAEPSVQEGRNRTKGLSNFAIAAVNDRVRAELGRSVRVWESVLGVSGALSKDWSEDGLTIPSLNLGYQLDILLNFYCNAVMRFGDGTCCSLPPQPSWLQVIFLGGAGLAVAVALGQLLLRCIAQLPSPAQILVSPPLRPRPPANLHLQTSHASLGLSEGLISSKIYLLGRLSLLILYLYACDRGACFMKENKWFSPLNFALPTLYVGVLGMFFADEVSQAEVLSEAQMEEWQGWMQLLILASHVTGAGQRLWARLLVHTLTSAHLFLLGYAQFAYHFRNGDFSVPRFLRILLRYNLLTGLLCLVMRRPYQYYQYIPMATYWYLFIFLLLACPPHITRASCSRNPLHFVYMVGKLLIFFSLISVLYLSEEFFDQVFSLSIWRGLFVAGGEGGGGAGVGGWWLLWWSHRYAAGAGLGAALAVEFARASELIDERPWRRLLSRPLSAGAGLVGVLCLVLFAVGLAECREEESCLQLLAYLSPVPILAYALLRNLYGALRCRLSHFFSWWGRMSVELWIVSWEGWLTADGEGVLVLWPRYNILSLITVSALLLLAAHEAHLITHSIIPILVPYSQPRILLRNILLLPLIPIFFFVASQPFALPSLSPA